MDKIMNDPDIVDDFQVKPKTHASFLVKWKWKSNLSKIAYFQISHAYQDLNETKAVYSPFIPGVASSSYTINNVQANRNYYICLKVFIRNISHNNELIRTSPYSINQQPSIFNPGKICEISMTTTSHLQAIVSCLIGVFIALMLLALLMMLCRSYKKWAKNKSIQSYPPGANCDYYERHRNSETNMTPTEEFSGFEDCDTSCTSQMIADGLAWSPSSSLYSQYNLSVVKTKSGLQNHTSSHPSSTPRILEEDAFYEGFVDKVPEPNDSDKCTSNRVPESVVSQKIVSPFFTTASCSTLNSFGCDNNQYCLDNSDINNVSILFNDHALLREEQRQNCSSGSTKSSNANLTLQLIDQV